MYIITVSTVLRVFTVATHSTHTTNIYHTHTHNVIVTTDLQYTAIVVTVPNCIYINNTDGSVVHKILTVPTVYHTHST